jgi:hypothetical protein
VIHKDGEFNSSVFRWMLIGWLTLAMIAGLVRFGYAGVFDGDQMTKIEKDWFDTRQIKSCCGLGDAFTTDDFIEQNGKYFAIITDGFDRYLGIQNVIPIGTRIEITKDIFEKTKDLPKNPTGHGIVFLRIGTGYDGKDRKIVGWRNGSENAVSPEEADVICYFPPAGG